MQSPLWIGRSLLAGLALLILAAYTVALPDLALPTLQPATPPETLIGTLSIHP